MMYFSRISARVLLRKEAILTKSTQPCESSNKFARKCKFLASNNEAILIYLPLKINLFTFYKRDSATFKLLNCLMSYKKHFNDKFIRMN